MRKNDVRPEVRTRLATLALLGAMCAAGATDAASQTSLNPTAASLAPRFTMIERSFVALAEAMPAEAYGFKPTDGAFEQARTFAEQVKHVACANFAFFNEVEGTTPPADCASGGPSPATTKDELVAYLRDSFGYAGRVIRATTAENVLQPTSGPYGGQSNRLALITLAVWHASDHYGQLVVYLRMNGVVPPASRPPGSS